MISRREYDIWDDESTDEQWAKIFRLADKGEADKMMDYLIESCATDPRAAGLFILAASEHKRLTAICQAARGARPEVNNLRRDLDFARRSTQAMDPATARELVDALESKLVAAEKQQSEAEPASVWLLGIARRFPRMFGVEPVGVGDKMHWPPVVHAASPAVSNELHRLYLPDDVVHPHLYFPPMVMPRKAPKTIQSPLIAGGK